MFQVSQYNKFGTHPPAKSFFFPNKLVDYILSFLQSDTDSLQKCTRSDPVLSKFAEHYIYADSPHLNVKSSATHMLTQILSNKPEIANYICSLTIHLNGHGNSPLITLSSLLPTFSQLTSVTIHANRKDSSWDKLPEKFREEFVVLLRAQLRELCISSLSSFIPICPFPSLLSLTPWPSQDRYVM